MPCAKTLASGTASISANPARNISPNSSSDPAAANIISIWASISSIAGAASIASADAETFGTHTDVADHAVDELINELVIPLRDRLERAFIDAGDQLDPATDHFRAIYREWKTARIDEAAANSVRLAHGRGVLAALMPGSPVCWVVDPTRPCAEGDDNVLGGVVPAGSDFPTGHRHAPAYRGCRCAIVPVHR